MKVTPARVPRDLLIRQRLSYDAPDFRDRPAIVAQAPAGFGKTAVLAQWRREHLARGTVVAWLSAQEEDDTQRFVRGLALAVRVASGRPNFGHTLLEGAVPAGLEAVTAWLDDVAQSALDIVMIIDEADRLPPDSREALTYLIHNAPSNLRIIVAARPECDLGVADLIPYGHCAMLGAVSLRFELEETIALARSRLNGRIDADTGARLHELTEGWPLGLQLALSAISRSTDARAAIESMAGRSGALHGHFVDALLANLEHGRRGVPDPHRDRRRPACRAVPGNDRDARCGRTTGTPGARYAAAGRRRRQRLAAHARGRARGAARALCAAATGDARRAAGTGLTVAGRARLVRGSRPACTCLGASADRL